MGRPIFKGNHHRGYIGHGSEGVGVQDVTVQMGWGSVTGKTGDVAFIQLSSLAITDINQGVFFQSECPVVIDYTLCNPSMSISFDPDIQASVLWDGAQAIPVGTMTEAEFGVFTAVRVTFNGNGTLYMGVR